LWLLGIGGYFLWRYATPEARVMVRNFLLTHAVKVAIIIGLVLGFFFSQAVIGSTKLF